MKKHNISSVLSTSRSITITPISYKDDQPSRIDYDREMENYINGFSVMWDDAGNNETKINDLFAFIEGQGRKETDVGEGYCQIRRVVGVLPHDVRPKYWKIPEHSGRNVIILSDIIYEGTWVELCEASGRSGWGKVLHDGTRLTSPRQGSKRWKLVSTDQN